MNSWIWVIFPDLVKFIERVIECCPAMQVGFFLGCRIREREFHWTNSPSDTWGRRAEGVKDHLACNTNCFYLPILHCIVQISARSHHTKKKHTTRVDGLWFIILKFFSSELWGHFILYFPNLCEKIEEKEEYWFHNKENINKVILVDIWCSINAGYMFWVNYPGTFICLLLLWKVP